MIKEKEQKRKFDMKQLEKEIIEIEYDIPVDPTPDDLKRILSEASAVIEYLDIKRIEAKKQFDLVKLAIQLKKSDIEIEKSRVRQRINEEYQKSTKESAEEQKKFLNKVEAGDLKMSSTMMMEIIKGYRPEKPTTKELDDRANLETKKMVGELAFLERQAIELEEQVELLKAKVKRYENKNFNSKSHIKLLEKNLPF